MGQELLTDRQRSLLRELRDLLAHRAATQERIEREFKAASEAAEKLFRETRNDLDETFNAAKLAQEQQFREQSEGLEREFKQQYDHTEKMYKGSLARIAAKAAANQEAAKKALQEAIWLTETVFEATETQPLEQFQTTRKGIDGKLEELANIEEKANQLLRRFRQRRPALPEGAEAAGESASQAASAGGNLDEELTAAQAKLDELNGMLVPRLFQGLRPVGILMLIVALGAIIAGWRFGWQFTQTLMIYAGIAVGGGAALLFVLYTLAKSQTSAAYRSLHRHLTAARAAAARALKDAEETREIQMRQLIEQRDRDIRLAHEKYDPILAQIAQRRDVHIQRIHEKYPKELAELRQTHEQNMQELREQHQARIAELEQRYARDTEHNQQRHAQQTQEALDRYQREWTELESRWKQGTAAAFAAVNEINNQDARLFRPWDDPSWNGWTPTTEAAPVIRFGKLHVDLSAMPGGLPTDERLPLPGPAAFDLPAMLGFPNCCSMLLQAGDEGRQEAIATLQTVMFRLLTSLPAGKVRFTIIDPVGLGQNFAGFMHLADYEGAFVTDKIWTEDRHIEQRLLDLTEHMENVIQKYLRNEYETISEYNRDAGEIAEPFRFLVIANFPVNFTETAARRLASIVNSGARCGVYTLITCDTRVPLPQGIQMADLEASGINLVFDKNARRFVWKDETYQALPLSLDAPPADDFITEKLHIIGQAAKESTRVEVPFEIIAPKPEELWSLKTDHVLRVPLGRCGATKLQYLTLGEGTSQHALVAGKTGSGKSTLLHALVTNLSLWYSPDEVEFYLIDFKKGVEFKTYATHQLPHARAVAIESDREFGLSVIQRLDAELKRRGNLFRDLGVQDLAGYRRLIAEDSATNRVAAHDGEHRPHASLPRVLLIIDEFQELFTEDDKLAQDAALLLDRLVRQGRAFGMHVLLGSQTLGGAYSLARSTINQMAVRIALQCSEADSYLILSDDNAAARLLSRPGEAIYNDASGMVEGNSPFQVVWLPEETREKYLLKVANLARERRFRRPEPQIVFEGNVPADLSRNHLLNDLLASPGWPDAAATSTRASAWLGEAIAIKDPTAAVFRRQSGNNLLIVGQREESALSMLAASLVSLAAQHAPGNARFYVLDGSPPDAPHAGYLERLSELLPHGVRVAPWRDVPDAINEIAEEIARRQEALTSEGDDAGQNAAPPIYLLIYGLQRYRMLRQEDDYGFSSSLDGDALPKPDKQFGTILREGPVNGVYTLAWCDTVNNVNRALDRQGLKEFEIRVLFQMGQADSSALIDSPAAAKLGLHRALFFSEEQGQLEKFRPYALPDERWLAEIVKRFSERTGAEAAR